MSTSHEQGDASSPPDRSTVILLLGDITSTTWRMFVPTVGLMSLGFFGDRQFGTWPWLFAVGIIIGTLITIMLIKHQLRQTS